MKKPSTIFDPRTYWEDRGRRFAPSSSGWKAVCMEGAPDIYNRLLHRLQAAALYRAIGEVRGDIAFELGCGVGRWLAHLSPRILKLHGGDFSYPMLSEARKNLLPDEFSDLMLCQLDGSHLPYHDSGFDLSFTVTMMIHLVDDELFKFTVRELCRVTDESGSIVILEGFASSTDSSLSHVIFRTEREVAALFREEGWALASSRPVYFFFPDQSWLKSRFYRALFRVLSPLFYLVNRWDWKLGFKESQHFQKIHIYRHKTGV